MSSLFKPKAKRNPELEAAQNREMERAARERAQNEQALEGSRRRSMIGGRQSILTYAGTGDLGVKDVMGAQ
jgi:hypothetical protein